MRLDEDTGREEAYEVEKKRYGASRKDVDLKGSYL